MLIRVAVMYHVHSRTTPVFWNALYHTEIVNGTTLINSCCCSLYFITRFRRTQKTPSSRLLVWWTILQQTAVPKPRLLQRRSLQCQIQCVLWWLPKTPRPGAILERHLLQIPELRSQGLVLLPWCRVQQKGVQDPRLLQRPAI